MRSRPWRVLFTGKRSGAFNMSVDAAVLRNVEAGLSPPTLRIYGWEPYCVSLGYFQNPLQELDAEALRDRGWDFVLRPTGGRAVLHAEEITYSLISRRDEMPWCTTLASSYERIAQAWAVALNDFDLQLTAKVSDRVAGADHRTPLQPAAPCFASTSRSELTFGTRKVVGSAQRRTRDAFLQHGSIPMTPIHERLVEVLRLSESVRNAYREALRTHAVSLAEIGILPSEEMDKWFPRLALDIFKSLGAEPSFGTLTPAEIEEARVLEKVHQTRQKAFLETPESAVIPA